MEETARKIKENASCWYAVYTAPRAEKKVKEQLDKIGVENYLPLQPVVRLWNNRKKKIFIPVVPGCLFVHISIIQFKYRIIHFIYIINLMLTACFTN